MYDILNNDFNKITRELTKEEKINAVDKYLFEQSCEKEIRFAMTYGKSFNEQIKRGKSPTEIVQDSDVFVSRTQNTKRDLNQFLTGNSAWIEAFNEKTNNDLVSWVAYNEFKSNYPQLDKQVEVLGVIEGFYDRKGSEMKIDSVLLPETDYISDSEATDDLSM